MRIQRGMTLIELMITVAISGIILAVAVPSFRTMIQNNRSDTLAGEFLKAMQLARSEAVKRGEPVTLCGSANTTQTTCGAATAWSNGWIIFSDSDGDGSVANAGDRIGVHDALQGGTTIATTLARITYSATGIPSIGAGTYTVSAIGCAEGGSRIVTVSNTGRASVVSGDCS